jgi:aminotransferase in exopolysaccharide biosynthesis
MSEFIPLSVPRIRGNEWKYIKECLDTEWVSSVGKYVQRFEEEICRYTGAKYAIACVNGTAALHMALEVVGVKEDDEVIVPTLTFIATVNVIRYHRAQPIFMDSDDYYCLDVAKTIDFIRNQTVFKNGFSYNKITHKRIPAIIPVHVFGNAANLMELYQICVERNITIIEDAAESIGTFYTIEPWLGKHTGTIGAIGCLSFNGNKIITTGGGGMLITDNFTFAERLRYLTTQAKDDSVRYIHHEIGYNYRLTNLQAAMGVAQLEQLPEYIRIKKSNFELYQSAISDIKGLRLVSPPPYARVNYWLYCLQIDPAEYGKTRDDLMEIFRAKQVETRPVWYLNHLQKPYLSCQTYHIENALDLWAKTLNIPSSVNLTREQIKRVVGVLEENASKA